MLSKSELGKVLMRTYACTGDCEKKSRGDVCRVQPESITQSGAIKQKH